MLSGGRGVSKGGFGRRGEGRRRGRGMREGDEA